MEIIYTTIGSSALLAIIGFLFKNLIIIRLKNAIKYEYDEKIEKLKSELKAKNDEQTEKLKSELKATNDKLTAKLAYLKDSKLQIDAEARKIKQDYYHMFLEAVSIKFSHLNNMASEEAISAQRQFCVEVNRLPLYASQEVVEFVSQFAGGSKAPEFTALYEVIRKDLCSNTYRGFDNLAPFYFQIPEKLKASK